MTKILVPGFVLAYFLLLLLISKLTSRGSDKNSFYLGNKKSPWFIVAFGMIGASLSGVTFISVPGDVGTSAFTYMQMVLGFVAGYVVIAELLLPLYYRLELVSIYTYLAQRFGKIGHKTGAIYFLISRVIGAAFRLFLVAMVMHKFILAPWNVPFWINVAIAIGFIYIYSFKNGIKTIVWTDTLQTLFLLLAAAGTFFYILSAMDWSASDLLVNLKLSSYTKMLDLDFSSGNSFFKHFISGMFISIAMTGLDQDMMQKNLSCKNIKEAKWNMYSMSISLIFANLLFLALGAVLYMYAEGQGILETNFEFEDMMANNQHLTLSWGGETGFYKKDELFPFLALNVLPVSIGILFVLGLIAAAYSSADSALTALTTSFCVDILGNGKTDISEKKRTLVHVGFASLLFFVILLFYQLNNDSIIRELFTIAGYTYGPLLGLYAFGIFSKRKATDKLIPLVCAIAPGLTWLINDFQSVLFGDFKIGFMILIINGLFTFVGLALISKK
jgi:Na+/proline symporter